MTPIANPILEGSMILGSAAFAAGQLFGLAILVLVIVGVVQTLTRSDMSWREKLFGKKDEQRPDPPDPEPRQG